MRPHSAMPTVVADDARPAADTLVVEPDDVRARPAVVTGWLRGTVAARVAVLITATPIVAAAVRGISRGWAPVGENALFQILARDVFSDHVPLTGLYSSASLVSSGVVHHPGPLLFDLLAPPVAVFGAPGVAVGIALVNVASVVGIAVAVHRRGGPLVVAGTMAVLSALLWSMGSEVLYDPWNPHAVLLPFLCFLVLVWSASAGDAAALPFAAVAGSVVLQTHVSYALLVPVLGLWGLAALLVAARRSPRGSDLRRRLRRALPVAVVVLLLCWAQPLIEQLWGDGPGNLGKLVTSSGDAGDPVGPRLGTRIVAEVVALPPFFLRPSFGDGWRASTDIVVDPVTADLPTLPAALATLAVVGVVLVALAVVARRRGDRTVVRLLVTALLALAVAGITAIQIPLGYFGVPLHFFRWLWAVAAFVALAIVVALLRFVPRQAVGTATVAMALVATGFSVANLPESDQGTIAPEGSIEAVRDLNGQLGRLEGSEDTYLVALPPLRFNDAYAAPVMAELQRRGIDFVVQPGMDHQLGSFRRLRAGNADAALRVVVGDGALLPAPGTDRVAFHDGLGDNGRLELGEAWAEVAAAARAGQLRLDADGEAARLRGELPWFSDRFDEDGVERLLQERQVMLLDDEEWLDLDPEVRTAVDRYVELQQRADNLTVAVVLDQLTPEEAAGDVEEQEPPSPCPPWLCRSPGPTASTAGSGPRARPG